MRIQPLNLIWSDQWLRDIYRLFSRQYPASVCPALWSWWAACSPSWSPGSPPPRSTSPSYSQPSLECSARIISHLSRNSKHQLKWKIFRGPYFSWNWVYFIAELWLLGKINDFSGKLFWSKNLASLGQEFCEQNHGDFKIKGIESLPQTLNF